MRRRFGLGLRAQILLALGVAFVASFPLLTVASVQLAQRARARDQLRHARATAHALARALEGATSGNRVRFTELADAITGDAGIAGVQLRRNDAPSWTHGQTETGIHVDATVSPTSTLRLWMHAPRPETAAPFTELLLLYLAVTGTAVLLLVYVVMTYLIVRPVEAVTRASERLAAGRSDVEAPVRGGAEVARLGVAFNDMAAQLRAERQALERRVEELERTTAELESAQEQVVRSARLASVGRLSAGIAHEIGNPLSAIQGLIEMVRTADLEDAEREEFLARMQAETERIHKIIRELLDFARQQPSDQERGASTDVRDVVEDAVRLVTPQKDLRHITIERRMPEAPVQVAGRSDELTQVVLNLLLNAADVLDGEGAIHIEITNDPERDQVRLAVEDTGPGIAEDVLDHVFEPFVTTKPTGQGTGLGLAVCHTIVQRNGGTIHAANAAGGGARFEVRLPRVAPETTFRETQP